MKRWKSNYLEINKSKEEYQRNLLDSSFTSKLQSLCRLQEKAFFFGKLRYKFTENFQMKKVIKVLDDLKNKKIVEDYVIGGATALLYYSTPALTEDIDVFITLKQSSILINISPIYNYLIKKYKAYTKNEYIFVDNNPIQFLVPGDKLTEEAFNNSKEVTVQGKQFKIFSLEYLIAIMLQLGKSKYRERLRLVKEEKKYNSTVLDRILNKYKLVEKWETDY